MLARIPLLFPGKALTNPLLLLLLAACVAIVVAMRRTTGNRSALRVALVAVVAIWFLATPVATLLLVHGLVVPADSGKPQVIVVASAGHAWRNDDPQYDWLSYASFERTVAGAAWWNEHRDARFILAGISENRPNPRRTLELMRDLAIQRGVSANRIEIDDWSRNTREHPLGVLRLGGITRETRIGVVTSAWHMRRTRAEFRKHFRNVIAHPVQAPQPGVSSLNEFLPDGASLNGSTIALQEWIGIAWYALRR